MGFKNLNYWLRYGIYVAILYPVIFHLLIYIGTTLEEAGSSATNYFFFPIFFLYLPIAPFKELFGVGIFVSTIILVLVGFIIGAIIGKIVEKVKSNRNTLLQK